MTDHLRNVKRSVLNNHISPFIFFINITSKRSSALSGSKGFGSPSLSKLGNIALGSLIVFLIHSSLSLMSLLL